MNSKSKQIIITVLTVVALILLIVDASILTVRCDFTKDGTYRISKISKSTLRNLDEKVRLTYIISDKVIEQRSFGRISVDLVRELVATSRGMVQLEILDPIKNKVSDADKKELEEWQLQQSDGKASASVNIVYSGIIINYKKEKEIIPLVREHNYQQLEYEIISRIKKLSEDFEFKIGIIDLSGRGANPLQSEMDIYKLGYNVLLEQSAKQIFKDFKLESLKFEEVIDNSYGAVIVLGATEISEKQLYIFDQYMMRGGALLFTVENQDVMVNPQNRYNPVSLVSNKDNILINYFKFFGVEFEEGKLMDANSKKMLSQMGQGQLGLISTVLQPRIVNANKDYPFNSNFNSLNLYWPDALKITEKENEDENNASNTKIILRSSKDSIVSPNLDARTILDTASAFTHFQSMDKDKFKSYPVAVHLYGELKSYYAEKNNIDSSLVNLYDTKLDSTDAGQFILISDREFLSDFPLIEGRSGQQALIQNLLYVKDIAEYLGGDKELLKVRTKIPGVRMMTAKPETIGTISIISIVASICISLTIVIFALVWLLVRNSKANKMHSEIKKESK